MLFKPNTFMSKVVLDAFLNESIVKNPGKRSFNALSS